MSERVWVHTPDPVRIVARAEEGGRVTYLCDGRPIGGTVGDPCDLEQLDRTGAFAEPRYIGMLATVSGFVVEGVLFAVIPPPALAQDQAQRAGAEALMEAVRPLNGLSAIRHPIGTLEVRIFGAADGLDAASRALASHLGLEAMESAESRAIRELLESMD